MNSNIIVKENIKTANIGADMAVGATGAKTIGLKPLPDIASMHAVMLGASGRLAAIRELVQANAPEAALKKMKTLVQDADAMGARVLPPSASLEYRLLVREISPRLKATAETNALLTIHQPWEGANYDLMAGPSPYDALMELSQLARTLSVQSNGGVG